MESFSDRLQAVARTKKIFQADLARGIGKATSTVSKWWNGDIIPGEKNISVIAEFFGCDHVWLASGEGVPFPKDDNKTDKSFAPTKGATIHAHFPNKSMKEIAEWISEQNDGIDYWEVAKAKMATEFPEFREWLKKRQDDTHDHGEGKVNYK